MDMTGSCGGYDRELWWICQEAVVGMTGSCGGYDGSCDGDRKLLLI